ncbi:hypothetical protein ACFY1P_21695 [Streptomyces sp. NPDC001407]|uniref:hypothetical protein n=1 Tax=unclassified Streptomyces TaxID=2593676 RepID=UPI0036BD5A54
MSSTSPDRHRTPHPRLPYASSEAVAAELEARAALRDMWQYGFPRCALTRYAEAAGRLADSLAAAV